MGLNHWAMFDGVATAVPERTAVSWRGRHLSYGGLQERARRLANLLVAHGAGSVTPRSELDNWVSGQDHVGLYLYNGPEYLEGPPWAPTRPGPSRSQRQRPLRRGRAGLPARRRRHRRARLPRRLRPDGGVGPAAPAPHPAPPAGGGRLGPWVAPRRAGLRGGPGRRLPRPTPRRRAERRRPLHPLYRRHHRHAEGHHVAPGRHLRRRARPLQPGRRGPLAVGARACGGRVGQSDHHLVAPATVSCMGRPSGWRWAA